MYLFSIAIIRNDVKPAALLASAKDVSSFSFFQQSTVSEFMDVFALIAAERTPAGQRQDIEDISNITYFYYGG